MSIEVPASGKPFVELGRRTVTESPVGVRRAIADEPGKSAALKRDRAELLDAMEGFQRALRIYADEIEARDDPDALEPAAAALERTGERYDKAFARFDP